MSSAVSSPLALPRPLSRSSSRNSISARSPSPLVAIDDPVAVRNHMSTLKHSIRHQQAQLHSLENIILRGPRPLPPGVMDHSPPHSPTESEMPTHTSHGSTSSISSHLRKRSSFDVLHNLAGPDSSLPLPKRDSVSTTSPSMKNDGGIREGVPMDFGVSAPPSSYKRAPSPTRTLSRIPVASVGNARALADEGQPATHRQSMPPGTIDISTNGLSPMAAVVNQSPSPNRRISLTPVGTSKVLADLQTGVVNARNALENTKAQLRLSQRSVAQLTRQTEDLKEGRERLRLENEGLNNVVARKERLLQEVLDRARKAESEAANLKTQLKTEQSISKKSLREMETALSESTALSQKSEREYITLRDSIKGLVESFKHDSEKLRDEMRKREEKVKKESEEMARKYKKLVEDVKSVPGDKKAVEELRQEDRKVGKDVEEGWKAEIESMKKEVEKSNEESREAVQTSRELATELARLRRLMRTAGQRALADDPPS